jgi:hypothetical protein
MEKKSSKKEPKKAKASPYEGGGMVGIGDKDMEHLNALIGKQKKKK